MAKVYVVVREGVYMQEILGVFKNELEADKCAKQAKIKEDTEGDGYHDFEVYETNFE